MATHLDGCAYRPQMKPCVGGSVHFSFLLRGNQSISVLRNWEREEESMDIRKWWKQRMSWESGMLSSWRLGLSSCGYKLKNRWVSSACVLLPQLTLVIYIRFWWISWLVETQLGDLSLRKCNEGCPIRFWQPRASISDEKWRCSHGNSYANICLLLGRGVIKLCSLARKT